MQTPHEGAFPFPGERAGVLGCGEWYEGKLGASTCGGSLMMDNYRLCHLSGIVCANERRQTNRIRIWLAWCWSVVQRIALLACHFWALGQVRFIVHTITTTVREAGKVDVRSISGFAATMFPPATPIGEIRIPTLFPCLFVEDLKKGSWGRRSRLPSPL